MLISWVVHGDAGTDHTLDDVGLVIEWDLCGDVWERLGRFKNHLSSFDQRACFGTLGFVATQEQADHHVAIRAVNEEAGSREDVEGEYKSHSMWSRRERGMCGELL